ncbi:mucin-3A-like [Cherax quadricarinatus]|uniref:mucin-3A-like n=1 Tax=Cherax quadricarinatus TaxID=27406 RepID=UPI00387E27DE
MLHLEAVLVQVLAAACLARPIYLPSYRFTTPTPFLPQVPKLSLDLPPSPNLPSSLNPATTTFPDITEAFGPPSFSSLHSDPGPPPKIEIPSLYSQQHQHSLSLSDGPVFHGTVGHVPGQPVEESLFLSDKSPVSGSLSLGPSLSTTLGPVVSQPDTNSGLFSGSSPESSKPDFAKTLSVSSQDLSQQDLGLQQLHPVDQTYSQPDSHSVVFSSDKFSVLSQPDQTFTLSSTSSPTTIKPDPHSIFLSHEAPVSNKPDHSLTPPVIPGQVSSHSDPHSIFRTGESKISRLPDHTPTLPFPEALVSSQPDPNSIFLSEPPVSHKPDFASTVSPIPGRVYSRSDPHSIFLSDKGTEPRQPNLVPNLPAPAVQVSSKSDPNSIFLSEHDAVSSQQGFTSTVSSIIGTDFNQPTIHSNILTEKAGFSNQLGSNLLFHSDKRTVPSQLVLPTLSSIPGGVYSQPNPHSVFSDKTSVSNHRKHSLSLSFPSQISSHPDPHSIFFTAEHPVKSQSDHSLSQHSTPGSVLIATSGKNSVFSRVGDLERESVTQASTFSSKDYVAPVQQPKAFSINITPAPVTGYITPAPGRLNLPVGGRHDLPAGGRHDLPAGGHHDLPAGGHHDLPAGVSLTHAHHQSASHAQHHSSTTRESAAKYDFVYKVKSDFGLDFGHQESRDGYDTLGSYYVLLPDGRRQKVSYSVKGDSGYLAVVEYVGEIQRPSYGRTDGTTHGSILPKAKYKQT